MGQFELHYMLKEKEEGGYEKYIPFSHPVGELRCINQVAGSKF
jgi:hypothetical protein